MLSTQGADDHDHLASSRGRVMPPKKKQGVKNPSYMGWHPKRPQNQTHPQKSNWEFLVILNWCWNIGRCVFVWFLVNYFWFVGWWLPCFIWLIPSLGFACGEIRNPEGRQLKETDSPKITKWAPTLVIINGLITWPFKCPGSPTTNFYSLVSEAPLFQVGVYHLPEGSFTIFGNG